MTPADIFAVLASAYIFFFWPGTNLFRCAKEYLTRPEAPWNLALFRIFFFAVYQYYGMMPAVWVAAVPESLRVPPPGYQALMAYIPFDPDTVLAAQGVLFVASGLALLGCWTRVSAWVAAAAGLYVFGLPNFFGKVNHGLHSYLWFAAILASSRCADVLSLDAMFRAFRQRSFSAPHSSRAYAVPLRLMALLLGVIYFSSGYWKIALVGRDWIFSDNLRLILQTHWLQRDFVPAFRIDHHPLLCNAAAFAVVAFELGFAALIFHPRLRLAAVAAGLALHGMIKYFLHIDFFLLELCYVVLIDWESLFRRLAQPLLKLSFFAERPRRLPLALRVPLAVLGFGSEDLRESGEPAAAKAPADVPWGPLLVGGLILTVQIYCSALRIDSWPFGVYPHFGHRAKPTMNKIQVEAVSPRSVEKLDLAKGLGGFHQSRWSVLTARVVNAATPEDRARTLEALTRMILDQTPRLREAEEMRFSLAYLSLKPEDWPRNPLGIKPLGSVQIANLKEVR